MSRTHDDACPGALHVHQAADGALARVRLPGGMIRAGQLQALADAAATFGAGTLELTSRGNLQLRGVSDTAGLADALAQTGLLPSRTHERVRNIVASPLTGRAGGLMDVRPLVEALDHGLCADPDLAGLPGRFLFSIDDGRGDVSGLRADAGIEVCAEGAALLLAGRDTGVRVQPEDAVSVLLTVARRFAAVRGTAWRISELDSTTALTDGFAAAEPTLSVTHVSGPPVGWIVQTADDQPRADDEPRVTLGAAVPLGVLTARQAQFVAAVDSPVVVTPWRSLLVCDLAEGVADAALRVLAPLGLVFDEASPWLRVSACVGSPGCERAEADVRAEATRAAESGTSSEPVHYVGCERGCGRPPTGKVLIVTREGITADART